MDSIIAKVALKYEAQLQTLREAIHRNPRTRWDEDETLALIQSTILEAVTSSNGGPDGRPEVTVYGHYTGGLVVDLDFNPTFDRVAFRADVDGLKVQEETELPFASERPDYMHACGHDVHVGMLVAAALALINDEVYACHNIRLIFDRAEENPGTDPRPESGAEVLIQEGVLQGVSRVYGLHIWNNPLPGYGEPGVFYSRQGGFLGNSGRLKFVFKTKGGHVAEPHKGVNGARIIHAVLNRLDGFCARHIDPLEPVTLEPVIIKSGSASNVLAQESEMWYGFRTVLPRAEHLRCMDLIEAEVKQIVSSFPGAELTEVKKIGGHPAVINTDFPVIQDLLISTGYEVREHPPMLGGESWAHYIDPAHGCDGSFWMLGAYTPGSAFHHGTTFNPDPKVFVKGAEFWLLLASTRLRPGSRFLAS